ncbi:site-specific DNA-methyltransferase [Phascolarctobacterium sp.]
MDKMRMESVDMTAQNIEKIGAMFPNCITETVDENGKPKKAINFELLKQMLADEVIDGDEAYEFTWVGKKAAIVEAHKPIRKTLRPCKEESKNWDKTENIYIEGDNLEVLKLLQESYLNKVKMIYIDPPYNTGNDFIYNDDFKMTGEEYSDEIGEIDADGNRMFKNVDSNGRFHSDWCSMIYSRLSIARDLLANDGVIFISIDDNEVDNLRKICDEVFGEKNFISQIIVQTNPRGRTFDRFIAKTHEYIIVYVRDVKFDALHDIPKDESSVARYQKREGDRKFRLLELRNRNPVFNRTNRPLMFYPLYADPDKLDVSLIPTERHTVEIFPRNSIGVDGCWTWGREKAANEIHLLVANLANTGKWSVFRKDYLEGTSLYTKSKGLWTEKEMNHEKGKEMVRQLFGLTPFDFPKSIDYIKKCLLIGTSCHDDIILDFFSGSATTAHAVMQLNAEDGGNRKFIMVQLPEKTDEKSEAYKAGYKNICEIGKERIRRAGAKIKEETGADIDYGFRVLKLDDSNMTDVYYSADEYDQNMLSKLESNVKADRSDIDLLFGCLLEWGLPLSMPYKSEQIEGCTVHTYNDGDLIACFDKNVPDNVIKTVAKRKPLRAVFRDNSFANSPAKINVTEIFKLLAPDTRVKVI